MITISGNLTSDPELRWTPSGVPALRMPIASTDRYLTGGEWKDGNTLYLDVIALRGLATKAAESLAKGDRVLVTGKLRMRTWEGQDGAKHTIYEVEASDTAPGKPAVARIELQRQREAQPGRAVLGLDRVPLTAERRPVLNQFIHAHRRTFHGRTSCRGPALCVRTTANPP